MMCTSGTYYMFCYVSKCLDTKTLDHLTKWLICKQINHYNHRYLISKELYSVYTIRDSRELSQNQPNLTSVCYNSLKCAFQ